MLTYHSQTLIKTCREIIALKPVEEPASAQTEAEGDSKTKKSVKFDAPEVEEQSGTAAALLAVKQKRAQDLLDVLCRA